MERVKPIPTGYTAIIIQAHPLQSLQIFLADTAFQLQELFRLDSELL